MDLILLLLVELALEPVDGAVDQQPLLLDVDLRSLFGRRLKGFEVHVSTARQLHDARLRMLVATLLENSRHDLITIQ